MTACDAVAQQRPQQSRQSQYLRAGASAEYPRGSRGVAATGTDKGTSPPQVSRLSGRAELDEAKTISADLCSVRLLAPSS